MNQQEMENKRRYFREWRARNKDKCRAYQKKYYLQNREKIDARLKTYRKAYYIKNREKAIQQSLDYYYSHRKAKIAYSIEHRRQHSIRYYGKRPPITGVDKAPYPIDGCCPQCGRKGILNFHHWDDNNPSDGLWLCVSCHGALHRILKHQKLKDLINR